MLQQNDGLDKLINPETNIQKKKKKKKKGTANGLGTEVCAGSQGIRSCWSINWVGRCGWAVRGGDGKAYGWRSRNLLPIILGRSVDFILYVRRSH